MNTHSGDRNLCGSRSRVNLPAAIALWLALCSALIFPCSSHAQSWQAVSTPFVSGTSLLLTDGTVIIQDLGPTISGSPNWWRLTPDAFGSYTKGTWRQIASLPDMFGQPYAPLYFGSAVLADGRVLVSGGEYNNGFEVDTNGEAIYDPVADTWTPVAAPFPNGGDNSTIVLPNGQLMMADIFGTDVALLDPASLTWSSPPPPRFGDNGKADGNDEEGWTLLPDGTVLTVDVGDIPNSEIYDPIYGDWGTAGFTPNPLADFFSEEIGPQVLRPDGTVVVFGATGFNAIYNWIGSTTQSPGPGTWANMQPFPFVPQGPGIPPAQILTADAPACLLTNGNVLTVGSPGIYANGLFFYEVDKDTNRLIPEPTTINNSTSDPSFGTVMLMLPNGQVMLSDFSNEVEFYNSIGGPNPAWAPAITSSPVIVTQGQTYPIFGTQFNGLSQCSAYGDDVQNATNYPLVRVTMKATGHVIYYRTHDHSTMAVATGAIPVSTNFDVPFTAELGAAQLVVVANGIPSLPVNVMVTSPPVANPQTVKVAHNKSVTFTLTGSDPNNLPLIFAVVTPPTNGTINAFNPNTGVVTYTPNTNFQGIDTFTFTVSNGTVTTLPSTVTLIVAAGTPMAFAQTDTVLHDEGKIIALAGTDPNDNPPLPLTFAIAKQPTNGTVSFLNKFTGTVTYLPHADFQGKDSFTYTVNNGQFTSAPATVSLVVAPAIPVANPQVVGIALKTAKLITVTGTDPDNPALKLTFAIVNSPIHGTLNGLNSATGSVTYTPTGAYQGDDTFTFTVTNGTNISSPATVTLVVAPATPLANVQSVSVAHNTAKSITLTGSDPDSPPLALTFAIATQPTHGTLSGLNSSTGAVTYTPTANYRGIDSFTFTTNNGVNTSRPAAVTLNVAAGVPTANPQSVAVVHNTAKAIRVTGTDPDVPALALSFAVAKAPARGTVVMTASTGAATYTPTANFHGTDSFTFTVSNGTSTSAPATVTVTVGVGTPTATPQTVSVSVNTAKAIVLTGSDSDNPSLPLTFAIAASPVHGTLMGLNTSTGAVTYTPTTGFHGADSFTFTVGNGTNKSAAAKVTLTVSAGG